MHEAVGWDGFVSVSYTVAGASPRRANRRTASSISVPEFSWVDPIHRVPHACSTGHLMDYHKEVFFLVLSMMMYRVAVPEVMYSVLVSY